MILFKDISQWQGNYNMAGDGAPVIGIKMSGGDAGLYYDSKASQNYNNAVNAGKVVIGYHFAGGTDPVAEADFFVRAMSPLAENDVLCLDWEVHHATPVQWCVSFMNRVHDKTGVWPLIYMNTSTCTSYDWSPVLKNCALWIADYRFTPSQNVPCGHPYIAHQYTSTPLDTDALFIDIPTLKKYGYHAPVAPAPAPVPVPLNTPSSSASPSSSISASTSASASISPSDSPELALEKQNNSLLQQILSLLQGLIAKITNIFK